MKKSIFAVAMAAVMLTGCGSGAAGTPENDTADKPNTSSAEQSDKTSGKKPAKADKSNASLDEGTGVLTLSGNVTLDEVKEYEKDSRVKSVVCKNGTVFPEDCTGMFENFEAESIDISNADTSNVVNMDLMFDHCRSMKTVNVSGIDTSKVERMNSMFYYCISLESLDITGFNMEHVYGAAGMFNTCEKLKELDLSNFNCTEAVYVDDMFSNCSGLTSLDLSAMDFSNVIEMSFMFSECSNLKEINFGDSVVASVTDLIGAFDECYSLETIDLRNFDVSNVALMSSMFEDCPNLKTILVSPDWDASRAHGSRDVFRGCENLVGGNGTAYDPEHKDVDYARIDTPDEPGYLTLAQ